MSYEDFSDFEINKLVSGKFRRVWTWKNQVYLSQNSTVPLDYCNNPQDAFPIIKENCIYLNPLAGGDFTLWQCGDKFNTVESFDENPLRAAMIVFLKMEDAKNDD